MMSNFNISISGMRLSESSYYSDVHRLYHNHCKVMGTRLDVVLHGTGKYECDHAFALVYQEVNHLEELLSRYRADSPLSLINRMAYKKSLAVEEELFGILDLCREYYDRTSGIFDISIGKVRREISNRNIDTEIAREMLTKSGMDKVQLDADTRTVSFLSPELELDLGGFGKGFALDRIKNILRGAEIADAFISFGESSILALGNHPHGTGWKTGINNVLRPGESLLFFELNGESLSTSGNGPLNDEEKMLTHIIHPKKGIIHTGIQHISASGPVATEVEVLTTALMAAGEEEKSILLERFPDCRVVVVKYDEQGQALLEKLNN